MSRLGFVLALVTACGGGKTPPPAHAPAAPVASDPSCPLEVPGTSIAVEDTKDGAALVFVTTGDVLSVRSRAATLADMHGKHDGPAAALGMMFSKSSSAVASEVDRGARVTFTATKPDDVAAVQSELHMHAGHLSSGSCAMAM